MLQFLPDNSPFTKMLVRSSSDYWGYWVKRTLDALPVGDYTTNRVRRSVERTEKCTKKTDFLPFCRERDGVGRLLSPQRRAVRSIPLRTPKEPTICPEKKLKRSLRLLTKASTVVPAVGTYMPADSWVKKSFRTTPRHHKVLSLPSESVVSSLQPSCTVSAVSSPVHLSKDKKTHRLEGSSKGRNDFGALELQGKPGEVRESEALRTIYAARTQAMTRFYNVSKRVLRRFRSVFPR